MLIGVGGQAARGARRLIHRVHKELDLPTYVFTDGDPYGWYIYSVIKQGSMALAAHSEFMSVPKSKFVGMTLDDIKEYKLENVTEGKYHDYRNDESLTPKQKIGMSMREVRDKLNELDKLVKMNVRLKNEVGVNSTDYWKNTHNAMKKISERLVKLANKVGQLY